MTINLRDASDDEIIDALVELPSMQLLTIITAVAKIHEKAQARAETISRNWSQRRLDDIVRRYEENEE